MTDQNTTAQKGSGLNTKSGSKVVQRIYR